MCIILPQMLSIRFGNNLPIKQMASRIDHFNRGKSQPTPYGKRMDRLSNRIFNEVTRITDSKNMRVVRLMSEQPEYEKEEKTVCFLSW